MSPDPQPAPKPANPSATEPKKDSDTVPETETETKNLDLPALEYNPDELTPGEAQRQRVEDATNEVEPGQTVVSDTMGNVAKTGAPRIKAGQADQHLKSPGTVSIATPLGIVFVTLEVEANGTSSVHVGTDVENVDFQFVEAVQILRG
jgi:hypothetical protein